MYHREKINKIIGENIIHFFVCKILYPEDVFIQECDNDTRAFSFPMLSFF